MSSLVDHLPPAMQATRKFVLAAYYALGLYFFIYAMTGFGRLTLAGIFVWGVFILPQLIFISGIQNGNPRSYAWVSFVMLLYFTHAVIVSFTPGRLLFGLVEALLSVIIFCGLIVYIRQYRAHFKAPL